MILFHLFRFGAMLRSWAQTALDIVTRYPWQAALIVALVFAWHQHRTAASSDAKWSAVVGQWQATNDIQRQTIATLTGALDDQSAHVRAWAETSKRRQNAAQAALRQARARSEAAEALATRIEREGAQRGSGGPECRSGQAVMAARSVL